MRGEPVGASVAERIRKAIEELGAPTPVDEPEPGTGLVRSRDELPTTPQGGDAAPGNGTGAGADEGMADALLDALRGEVRPVSHDVARLLLTLDSVTAGVAELRTRVRSDRVERIEDLELMVDLLTNGWRTVDVRLGRVELALQRIEAKLGP